MLREIILSAITAIGALCGLGVTLMAASAPNHFPNAPPWAVHAAFWAGIAVIAIMVLDATLLFLWQDWRPRLGPGIVLNLATAAIALALVWHYSPIHFLEQKEKGLPGFTAFAFVRLDNTPAAKNRYVFDQVTSDGAGAAFYQLASSSLFIFSIKDTHGAFYNLEIPVGDKGVPVDRYVFLYCDAGIGKGSTVARVMIDGIEVRRRVLDFPMDLGKQDWKQVAVGTDSRGQNDAPFKIGVFGVGQEAFSNSDIRTHYIQFVQFLKDSGAEAGDK
jgi:hypothetical protein